MSCHTILRSLPLRLLLVALLFAATLASPVWQWDLGGPIAWPELAGRGEHETVRFRTAPFDSGQSAATPAAPRPLRLRLPLA
jgi:hypothetical protein